MLASGSGDKTVKIIDFKTQKVLHTSYAPEEGKYVL